MIVTNLRNSSLVDEVASSLQCMNAAGRELFPLQRLDKAQLWMSGLPLTEARRPGVPRMNAGARRFVAADAAGRGVGVQPGQGLDEETEAESTAKEDSESVVSNTDSIS